MVYADGNSYEGTWENGMMHGMGTLMLASGIKYLGEFSSDGKHGYGVIYDAAGSLMKSGIWEANQLATELPESETLSFIEAKLEATSSSSGCVEGNCSDGVGKFIYEDGNSYHGDWKEGMKHGYGMLKLAAGAQYHGEFDNNNMQGYGIVYGNDGGYLHSGIFENNELKTSMSEVVVASYLTNKYR